MTSVRHRVRRAAKAVLLALALTCTQVSPAGAQSIDGWWLTSHGSAHVLLTGNHLIIEPFDGYGNSYGLTVYEWIPGTYCQLNEIRPGNAAGLPLELRFYNPSTACIAVTYGWWDGGAQVAGTIGVSWPAEHADIYFPRRGTAVRVW